MYGDKRMTTSQLQAEIFESHSAITCSWSRWLRVFGFIVSLTNAQVIFLFLLNENNSNNVIRGSGRIPFVVLCSKVSKQSMGVKLPPHFHLAMPVDTFFGYYQYHHTLYNTTICIVGPTSMIYSVHLFKIEVLFKNFAHK
jgi:hypothetical protein